MSSDEKALCLVRKARANNLAPSSSSTSSGHAIQWPIFLSPSIRSQVMECKQHLALILTWIRYRSWSVCNLTFDHISLLTVSLGDLLVQTQRVGDINPTFLLSGCIPRYKTNIFYETHDLHPYRKILWDFLILESFTRYETKPLSKQVANFIEGTLYYLLRYKDHFQTFFVCEL